MNLTEVIVAASVLLSACSGAAQLGASSAQAMANSRSQAAAVEQIEAQLLAVAPVLQRQLSLAAGGEQVQLVLTGAGNLRRSRLLHPAAFGLCGLAAQEGHDAPL